MRFDSYAFRYFFIPCLAARSKMFLAHAAISKAADRAALFTISRCSAVTGIRKSLSIRNSGSFGGRAML